MIKLNLLPQEFRKTKAIVLTAAQKRRIGLGVSAIFLGVTVILYMQYHRGLREVKELQARWNSIQQDVQRVTGLQVQVEEGSKKEKALLERYVTSPFPVTAILNGINQHLPDSVWVIELKVDRSGQENRFLVKGFSLASARSSSIQDIEKYLRDLKRGFPPSTELVLTTNRQIRENKELTLFTAVFRWS